MSTRTVPDVMQAIAIRRTGGPDVLEHLSMAVPEPADGQVLIQVRAAAVNPVDWKIRRGLVTAPLPAVPGSDIAGVVVASHATQFAPGDAVCGMASTGGYAQLAAADARHLSRVPEQVSFVQAAAVVTSGLTAWQVLFDHADVGDGRVVVITGAAGGVGHLAVQFATLAGAHVTGTGSARSRAIVRGLGADEYVDYSRQDVADVVTDADTAVDIVGGATTRALARTVRPGGVLVSAVYPRPDDWPEIRRVARASDVDARHVVMRPDAGQLQEILDLLADGTVQVRIAGVLPLDAAAAAQQRSEAGHTHGKLVLVPGNGGGPR